jgi:hypothetical protein
VLIADTGYELYANCETVRDLDQLYGDLGMGDEMPEDAMHSVCDPELPDAGEVWGGVVETKLRGCQYCYNTYRWEKHCRRLFELAIAA